MGLSRRRIVFLALLMQIFLLVAPAAQAEDNVAVKAVVEGNTAFALDLYRQLRTSRGNLFFSPYSVSTALAMTSAGAKGNTSRQMSEVLHFTIKQQPLHRAFNQLEAQLNALEQEKGIELRVANSLWVQEDHPFLSGFFEVVKRNYQAQLSYADFTTAPEAARSKINAWVERQTNEKIKDLIKPGVLSALTRLVLANAIYFKGVWASQFDKKATGYAKFWLNPNTAVDLPMMMQEHQFNYMENDKLQVLELPYAGNDLSMIVLLSKKVQGLAAVENSLTVESLSTLLVRLRERTVMVYLPRFKLTSEFSLESTLASMGMPAAFNPQAANFADMDGTRMLYISAVVHKAFVEVNEEGTEATAATGVVMTRTAAHGRPTVFRADHPFVLLIRDSRSGSILFIGRMLNPAA